MSIIGQKFWKVDSVNGGGMSVKEVEEAMVKAVTSMPFWNELIPLRFCVLLLYPVESSRLCTC